MKKNSAANFFTHAGLKVMASFYNTIPRYRKYLRNSEGWINFAVGIRTENDSVRQTIRFSSGRAGVSPGIQENTDVCIIARDEGILKEMATVPPNEVLNMMLRNQIMTEGNLAYLQLFNYLVANLVGSRQQKSLDKAHKLDIASRKSEYGINDPALAAELVKRRDSHLHADSREDENVRFLTDPFLPEWDLADFPRLKRLQEIHLETRPEICAERPRLLTEWYREKGFEKDARGKEWDPRLRQGQATGFLLANKKPIIAKDQLLAGTTTRCETCGVIVYPDAQGTMIWGELNSIDKRHLNPYTITEETRSTLRDVFPFWVHRNFREGVREKYGNPLGLQIDEHWMAYFCWKSVGLSHTVPDFPSLLSKGTGGIKKEIRLRLEDGSLEEEQKNSLQAMIYCLEGLEAYADHLSAEAAESTAAEKDAARRAELLHMAEVCARVPREPAGSLQEALQSLWTAWIALHMENTNTGLSLGRLDQWLQPYFLMDLEKCRDEAQRQEAVRRAVELTGCFMLRCTDHMPLSPDIGNYLFGGSPADQAITLGGITPGGEDGVNDMTYIFLKATEMLGLHDPNMNARINLEKNSDTYIRRLCEVNYVTSATPSLHNDASVFRSLAQHGYPREHMNDWCAIGCVEQTISGRHIGHTGSILMNMVAALEMALNNGRHPAMRWDLGPRTGEVKDFRTFDEFFEAYAAQQRFLIAQAVDLNNKYAEFHARFRPTPLLSALIDGSIAKGKDITSGGALYNTSGSSNIGLADVTDSLMAIRKLVFEEKRFSFTELKKAVDADFEGYPAMHALVQNKVPLFGSGRPEPLALADRIAALIHDTYRGHRNYRGGPYTSGFWSMSQHVAYGNLSGTLPSGRLAGKAFTPGLTPEPHASRNYLDFISDVAKLDERNMDNNIAFNVKMTPGASDSREKTVGHMASYVKTYCGQGGMQMQFNLVTSRVLKDAMAHPENYRNLLVRISGYNAYFVTLNKQQQIELIERAEFAV